jgi:hypothetical protein
MVIYFLVHVKNPAVLPNLQQMPPLRPISKVCFIEFGSWICSDWMYRRILIWVDITPGLLFLSIASIVLHLLRQVLRRY